MVLALLFCCILLVNLWWVQINIAHQPKHSRRGYLHDLRLSLSTIFIPFARRDENYRIEIGKNQNIISISYQRKHFYYVLASIRILVTVISLIFAHLFGIGFRLFHLAYDYFYSWCRCDVYALFVSLLNYHFSFNHSNKFIFLLLETILSFTDIVGVGFASSSPHCFGFEWFLIIVR